MKRIEPIILGAGVGFYALAMTSQGLIPLLEDKVTHPKTVRWEWEMTKSVKCVSFCITRRASVEPWKHPRR